MASEAQKRATRNYLDKNNLVETRFRTSAEDKEYIHNKAKELGYPSFNQFAIQAIYEKIERESK